MNGYYWQTKYWGTKWDIYGDVGSDKSELENAKDDDIVKIVYTFDTAWSPPLRWVEKVAKDFPQLTFTISYMEPGVGFAGKFSVSGENILEDTCNDYYVFDCEE